MFRLFPRYALVETTDREKFRKLRYHRCLINENARTAFPSNWHNLYVIAKTHPVVKFTRTGIVFARNSPAEYAAYLKLKIREKNAKSPLRGKKFHLRELKHPREEMEEELHEHLQIKREDGELVFKLHGREIGTAVVDKLDGKQEVFELKTKNLPKWLKPMRAKLEETLERKAREA